MRPPLLIVGQSGRSLAAAAAPHWTPWVIDIFGDTDTRALAARWAPLGTKADGRFERAALEAALDRCLAGAPGAPPTLLASGFENVPELLDLLAAHVELLGASAAQLRRLRDVPALFGELAAAGVRVPPTRRTPPPVTAGWLRKQGGECGGFHVRPAAAAGATSPHDYYQAEVSGANASALYLAGARQCRLLGMTRHLRQAAVDLPPWAYQGALLQPGIEDGRAATLAELGRTVAACLELRGAFGLDFVLDGADAPVLVDINLRFTATLDLYPERSALLEAHVAACRSGRVDAGAPRAHPWRGLIVLYAPRDLVVPASPRWPQGAADLPTPGSAVRAGQPLLTLVAGGANAADVRARLALRARAVFAGLDCAVPEFELFYLGGDDHA